MLYTIDDILLLSIKSDQISNKFFFIKTVKKVFKINFCDGYNNDE